jgi:soluble lytic murein transglycosylase-like protein
MKTRCSLTSFLLPVVLFLASNVGLAQSMQSGSPRQEEGPFAEINQRLNEAADAKVANALPPAPSAALGNSKMGTGLSSALFAVSAQKDLPARRANAKQALARLDVLRPIIEPGLARAGIPVELAGMVLVESGAQPFALSPKGALGLWQLMPETALRYGLTVNAKRDDRLNPEASTRAAAAYIRDLWLRFKDWRLVLAAYNAGEDKVQKAIERAGTSDYQTLSAKKLIPEETRNYVPAVLRAITLLKEGRRVQAGGPEFAARLLYVVPTT